MSIVRICGDVTSVLQSMSIALPRSVSFSRNIRRRVDLSFETRKRLSRIRVSLSVTSKLHDFMSCLSRLTHVFDLALDRRCETNNAHTFNFEWQKVFKSFKLAWSVCFHREYQSLCLAFVYLYSCDILTPCNKDYQIQIRLYTKLIYLLNISRIHINRTMVKQVILIRWNRNTNMGGVWRLTPCDCSLFGSIRVCLCTCLNCMEIEATGTLYNSLNYNERNPRITIWTYIVFLFP